MKLLIINGSPRYKKSNSTLLIDHFLKGYNSVVDDEVPVYYLQNLKHKEILKESLSETKAIILIFPLYTDSMPGIVKEFLEEMAEISLPASLELGYIIQSGFPEGIHSTYTERYLEKYTRRINCKYIGSIIKGGVEGIQTMPASMTRKLFTNFEKLGVHFAKTKRFEPSINAALRSPLKMSLISRFIYQLIGKTLTNFYWNSNLKKHNAYEKRFEKPFLEE